MTCSSLHLLSVTCANDVSCFVHSKNSLCQFNVILTPKFLAWKCAFSYDIASIFNKFGIPCFRCPCFATSRFPLLNNTCRKYEQRSPERCPWLDISKIGHIIWRFCSILWFMWHRNPKGVSDAHHLFTKGKHTYKLLGNFSSAFRCMVGNCCMPGRHLVIQMTSRIFNTWCDVFLFMLCTSKSAIPYNLVCLGIS